MEYMNRVIEDKNIYPLMVNSKYLINYLKGDVPCIVVFDAKGDPISQCIVNNINFMCRRYPKVFCYKVRWGFDLDILKLINKGELYNVTIWKSCEKIIFYKYPSIDHLNKMFSYVQNKIDGEYRMQYLVTLFFQEKRIKRNEKRRLNYMKKRELQSANNQKITQSSNMVKSSKLTSTKKQISSKIRIRNIKKIHEKFLFNPRSQKIYSSIKRYNNLNKQIINFCSNKSAECNSKKIKRVNADELSIAEGLILISQGLTAKNIPKNEIPVVNKEINLNPTTFNIISNEIAFKNVDKRNPNLSHINKDENIFDKDISNIDVLDNKTPKRINKRKQKVPTKITKSFPNYQSSKIIFN